MGEQASPMAVMYDGSNVEKNQCTSGREMCPCIDRASKGRVGISQSQPWAGVGLDFLLSVVAEV